MQRNNKTSLFFSEIEALTVPDTTFEEVKDTSQNLFPDSPVYEPEEEPKLTEESYQVCII